MGLGPSLLETTFFGYRSVLRGYKGLWDMRPRARGTIRGLFRSVIEEVMGAQKFHSF